MFDENKAAAWMNEHKEQLHVVKKKKFHESLGTIHIPEPSELMETPPPGAKALWMAARVAFDSYAALMADAILGDGPLQNIQGERKW